MRMATKSRDSDTNTVKVIKNQYNVSISTKTISVVKSKDTIVRVVKKCDSTKTSKKIVKDDDVEDLDDVVLEKLECQYGGNCKKLCSEEECTVCFNKSFASSLKKHLWSDKNDVTPRDVFFSSCYKFMFKCDICYHEYWTALSQMNKGCSSKCPYCANSKLCADNNCKICFGKSFASSDNSQFWSVKNIIMPRDVIMLSEKKYLFDCNVCKHEFWGLPALVSRKWYCPYCTNQQLCSNMI